MDILETIRQFLSEQYGIEPASVVPEASLAQLGIDSLIFVELVFEFESRFGITAPMEELTRPATVAELITLIDKLRATTQ
jgi:acyl carrier protein